jgi:hypothetical protein
MPYPIGIRMVKGVTLDTDINAMKEWFQWMKDTGFEVVDAQVLTPELKQAIDQAGLQLGSFDVTGVPQLFNRDEQTRF